MPSHDISVRLAEHAYAVTVQPGLLREAGARLRQLSQAKRVGVLTDTNVGPAYLPPLRESLAAAGFEPIDVAVPPGEEHKTLADLYPAYDKFLAARLERSTPIIGLGGGIVTDMAGFVAATILRGVPLVQIPTTLLAMVDASVGGKTGVNHAVGKNLIGAFHQPIAVWIDTEVLRTLPQRELRSGLAECIKHDIIRDAEGFARLEREIDRVLRLDVDYLTDLVAHNVAIKARVVEADPFEHGERAHLNFGHTFGHAIETCMGYRFTHGECVALGMAAATFAAMKLGMFADDQRKRVLTVIEKAGLPTMAPGLPVDRVIEGMSFDKKVRAGRLRFVLPDRIGHVVVRDDVPAGIAREAVAHLRG